MRFVKTKTSSIVMSLKTMQIRLFFAPAKPSRIRNIIFDTTTQSRGDINRNTQCLFSQNSTIFEGKKPKLANFFLNLLKIGSFLLVGFYSIN